MTVEPAILGSSETASKEKAVDTGNRGRVESQPSATLPETGRIVRLLLTRNKYYNPLFTNGINTH